MAIDLTGLSSTIQQVILAVSGLTDGQVVLGDQTARAPAQDYIRIRLDGPRTVGGPKLESTVYDGTQPLGQEVQLIAEGPGEWTIGLQAFTFATVDSGDQVKPNPNAQALLANVKAQLQLSLYRAQLNAGGVSIFDFGNVQNIPRVYGSDTEGRASLDMLMYYREIASYRTGYIATVNGGTPATPPAGGWTPPGSGPTGSFST